MTALSDSEAMRAAISAGEQGRLSAPPNPWVGCVVVRDGALVGQGFHARAGEAHAETVALRDAGGDALGATVFTTLEPCAHHGRTPPCAEALIEAGVRRVVVGVMDPDPRVQGNGITLLRGAGIDVEVGAESDLVGEALRPYLHQRTTGRPWCVLKSAVSIDGRTAATDGSSQWITGESAREDAHRLRARSQAIVVGSGTALADRPELTVRVDPLPTVTQPLRVLLDARGRVPTDGPLFDLSLAPTLIVTTSAADGGVLRAWKAAGAEVAEVGAGPNGGVDLGATLDLLGRRGILQALVEGGATLHGSFVAAGLANEAVVYVGGTILGDGGAAMARVPVPSIDLAPRWALLDVAQVGQDVRMTWRPN